MLLPDRTKAAGPTSQGINRHAFSPSASLGIHLCGFVRIVPARLLPAGSPQTGLWSHGHATPGETPRLVQGSRLRRWLVNNLLEPITPQWPGIHIDNAMDEVAGLTQEPVKPGAGFVAR